jgi:hemerythrin-like domain-containing protein
MGSATSRSKETVLLPALPQTDEAWAAAARRVRREHEDLRARAADLAEAGRLEAARELGQRLREHVRFEENELFPLLEERLAPDALAALGRDVDAAE